MNHPATDLDPLDRIDRTIDIDASAERVWDLVTRPGWWINEGTVDDDPDVRVDGVHGGRDPPEVRRVPAGDRGVPPAVVHRLPLARARHGRRGHPGRVPDRAARVRA